MGPSLSNPLILWVKNERLKFFSGVLIFMWLLITSFISSKTLNPFNIASPLPQLNGSGLIFLLPGNGFSLIADTGTMKG